MNRSFRFFLCVTLMIGGCLAAGRAQPEAPAPQAPTVIDGALGPCSLELTVTTGDGKPASGAKVKVHIAYRFGGFHKLDLEAGANSEGKVKFTGLPSRVRRPPLEFHAYMDQLEGVAMYDPATECQGRHEVKLEKRAKLGPMAALFVTFNIHS